MSRKEIIYINNSFGIINSRIPNSENIPIQNRMLYQTGCKDSDFKMNVIKIFQHSIDHFFKVDEYKSEIIKCLIPAMIHSFDKKLSKFDIINFIKRKILKPETIYNCMVRELYQLTFNERFQRELTFDDYFLMLIWSVDCVLGKSATTDFVKYTNSDFSMIRDIV